MGRLRNLDRFETWDTLRATRNFHSNCRLKKPDVEIPPFGFGIAMESLISLTENPVGSEA